MNIAIIGAGFTGLSSGYALLKKGHRITIFEKDSLPGGLAIGFGQKNWKWSLEKHYHHWFTNDKSVLKLAKEINFEVIIKRPKTSIYCDGKNYQLDSLKSLIKFPLLSLVDRLRMAGILGFFKFNPFWKPLERISASKFLRIAMGKNVYTKIWEPQLRNKFGKYIDQISLAWFWARIKKRTPNLLYPNGGFLKFAETLVKECEKKGGKFLFNTEVVEIKNNKRVDIKYKMADDKPASPAGGLKMENFDAVVVTLPSFFFTRIAPQLPISYKEKLEKLKGLGALNLVLRLKKQFMTDGTYWLSVCDKKSPIMAVVEHTNFMDKEYYDNEHIVYLGNYLPADHPYMKMTEEELLEVYDPFLKKLNPSYRLSLIAYHLFKAPFAQPIIPTNYSKIMPSFETPIPNVYLANIQQVYPWDRGTNYAVELGQKVAEIINKT